MIDWIVEQQGVLSLTLVFLIIAERFLTSSIHPKFAYGLWLLVPFVLLCNNAPESLATMPTESFSRYVVSVNPSNFPLETNWLFVVWLFGVVTIIALVLPKYAQLYRSLGRANIVSSKVCHTSELVTSPVVIGLFSPKILIPENFKHLFCEKQQKMVIEHEGIHIRHGDHVWNAFALFLMILFWFNPLMWIAARCFRVSQERACDSQALKNKSKAHKILYVKALLQCAEQRGWEQSLFASLGNKNTLLTRINFIKQPRRVNRYVGAILVFFALTLSINTLFATTTKAQNASVMINDIAPSKRVEPLYPTAAAENGQEGSVILKFDITASGTTDNIEIVQSFPAGVFDQSAINALKQWEYKSHIENGYRQRISGAFVQLDYRLYPREIKK